MPQKALSYASNRRPSADIGRSSSNSLLPPFLETRANLRRQSSSRNLSSTKMSQTGEPKKPLAQQIRMSHPLPSKTPNDTMQFLMPQKSNWQTRSRGADSCQGGFGKKIEKQVPHQVQFEKQFENNMKIIVREPEVNPNTNVRKSLDEKNRSKLFGNKSKALNRSAGNLRISKTSQNFEKSQTHSTRRRVKSQQKVPLFLRNSSGGKKKKASITLNDFQQINKLGQGAIGEVFLVRHKRTGLICCLKIIRKEHIQNQHCQENIDREIQIHMGLQHKNVVKLYGIFSDEVNLYMILEYMTQGSLWHAWKKNKVFPQKKAAKIILDMCRAVRYLHLQDIIHRDIKLENILMAEGIAKLGDFGCAVQSVCMRKSTLGSPNYLSPEQITHRYYNRKVDVWSLGIVAYEILFGFSPFEQQIVHSLIHNTHNPIYQLVFPAEIPVSDEAKDFLVKMLERNPNDRMQIDAALNHSFLQQVQNEK